MTNLINTIINEINNFKLNFENWETFEWKYDKINTSNIQDNFVKIKIYKEEWWLYTVHISYLNWRNLQNNKSFNEVLDIIKEI